jgi:ABC-type polysaccharide/polyol phosphate transport system ATPase subunit
MEPVIAARALSKSFRVYAHPKDMLLEFVTRRARHAEFAALSDVSFEIQPGEIVGILGRNGAGKSTLLKLLAHTLEPTSGSSSVRGRVSAILELGTGFHPDYSGRENALLGAICLGMSRREARERLDSIIAFAELGEFIDRPFRTYSSGMQARLTFATAVASTPEVLIVDEALAVGDARFQLRCFDRIREMRDAGCTILFVSHSVEQVTGLCTRAMLLEKGRLLEFGDPGFVTRAYHRLLFGQQETTGAAAATVSSSDDGAHAMGTGSWRITGVELRTRRSAASARRVCAALPRARRGRDRRPRRRLHHPQQAGPHGVRHRFETVARRTAVRHAGRGTRGLAAIHLPSRRRPLLRKLRHRTCGRHEGRLPLRRA